MPNFIKDNPVGIDAYIQSMQISMYEYFCDKWQLNENDWNSYGRLYRLYDSSYKEYLPYPFLKPSNVTINWESGNEVLPDTSLSPYIEYENPTLFNDNVKLQSFFDISESQKIDSSSQSSTKVVIYFFANLQTLFYQSTEMCDENFCNEVASFCKMFFLFNLHSKRIGIKTVMKDFSGYSKDNIMFSDKQPLFAFSLEFEVKNYIVNYNEFTLERYLNQSNISMSGFAWMGMVGAQFQLYAPFDYTTSNSEIASIDSSNVMVLNKEGSCEITELNRGFIYTLFVGENYETTGKRNNYLNFLKNPKGIDFYIQKCQINLYTFLLTLFNGNPEGNEVPFNYFGKIEPSDYSSFGRVYKVAKKSSSSNIQYYPQAFINKNGNYGQGNQNEYVDVLFDDTKAVQSFFDVGEAIREEPNSLLSYVNIRIYFFVDLSKLYVPKRINLDISPKRSTFDIPTRMDEEFITTVSGWLMQNSGFELHEIQRGIKSIMSEYSGFEIKYNSKSNMQPFLCFRCDMKKYFDESIENCY